MIILSAIRTQKYTETWNDGYILKLEYMIAHQKVQYMTIPEQTTTHLIVHYMITQVEHNISILARLVQAKLAYYCVQRGHFPFLKASGFSSIAALA